MLTKERHSRIPPLQGAKTGGCRPESRIAQIAMQRHLSRAKAKNIVRSISLPNIHYIDIRKRMELWPVKSCHESMHGLYPVRYEGSNKTVDFTSHEQALQFSLDGKYAGPITCAACHTVNGKGVPIQLSGTSYENDYGVSIVLVHSMREGDEKMPVADLVKKFPYRKSQEIVSRGWR
jgi:hypothetical protein